MDLRLPAGQNIINYICEKYGRLYIDAEGIIYLIKDIHEELRLIGAVDDRPITATQKKVLVRHCVRIIAERARTDDMMPLETMINATTFAILDILQSAYAANP